MPCDSVIKMTTQLKAMNEAVLKRAAIALKKEGLIVTVRGNVILLTKDHRTLRIVDGKATYDSRDAARVEGMINSLQDAYSKESVRTAFRKYGFTITQSATQKNKDVMVKATFAKTSFKKQSQKAF